MLPSNLLLLSNALPQHASRPATGVLTTNLRLVLPCNALKLVLLLVLVLATVV
jgi:hypothetical protein